MPFDTCNCGFQLKATSSSLAIVSLKIRAWAYVAAARQSALRSRPCLLLKVLSSGRRRDATFLHYLLVRKSSRIAILSSWIVDCLLRTDTKVRRIIEFIWRT